MTTNHEAFERFDNHAAHLLGAIRLCLKHEFIVPAMMLTYAGIDGMACLHREHTGQTNTGDDFKKWVDPCEVRRVVRLR